MSSRPRSRRAFPEAGGRAARDSGVSAPACHGQRPSISTLSDHDRNVLITTSIPSTAALSSDGSTATVRTTSAATRISKPRSSALPSRVRYSRWVPASRRPRAALSAATAVAQTIEATMMTTASSSIPAVATSATSWTEFTNEEVADTGTGSSAGDAIRRAGRG